MQRQQPQEHQLGAQGWGQWIILRVQFHSLVITVCILAHIAWWNQLWSNHANWRSAPPPSHHHHKPPERGYRPPPVEVDHPVACLNIWECNVSACTGAIWSPTQGVGTLLIASTIDLFHFSIASAKAVCLGGWLARKAESWLEKDTLLALACLITTLTTLFKGCLLHSLVLVLVKLFCTLTLSGLLNVILQLCSWLYEHVCLWVAWLLIVVNYTKLIIVN